MKKNKERLRSKAAVLIVFSIFFCWMLSAFCSAYDVPADTIVYVTNTGSKYHREGCSYLKSSNALTIQEAVQRGYEPCSRCNPGQLTGAYNSYGGNLYDSGGSTTYSDSQLERLEEARKEEQEEIQRLLRRLREEAEEDRKKEEERFKAAKEKREREAAKAAEEAARERATTKTMRILAICFFGPFVLAFIGGGVMRIADVFKRKKRMAELQELLQTTTVREFCGVPEWVVFDEQMLPHGKNRNDDPFEVYVTPSGSTYHKKGCYRNAKSVNIVRCSITRPCSKCKPVVPDVSWYPQYLRMHEECKRLGIEEKEYLAIDEKNDN